MRPETAFYELWVLRSFSGHPVRPGRLRRRPARLVRLGLARPPVARAFDVVARVLAEAGGAGDEQLAALRPGPVAPPRPRWHAHRVPPPQLDHLVVDRHPPTAADHHVDLLLARVRVAVGEPAVG